MYFYSKQTRVAALLAGSTLFLAACGGEQPPSTGSSGAEEQADTLTATFEPMPTITPNAEPIETTHPNSIQPETTLSISGMGEVTSAPDLALIQTGVRSDGKTASEAMATNRSAMNGVFDALKDAGIAERDMQTSNFSLQPQYDYSSRSQGEGPRLTGYQASNQLTVRVRDLDALGETMDALVEAGGNTFSGLRFSLDDPRAARNEARRIAIKDAITKAELYAEEAGYKVARIVTVSESDGFQPPQPMAMARMSEATFDATPVASGEVSYSINVNVVFELRQ